MYAIRFAEVLSNRDIAVLRGMEGGRLRETYRVLAQKYGIDWKGRRYDRADPTATDVPNQAINHASTFVESAAEIAVAAVGALPPLGFIHEESSNAFTLDIADLWRAEVTIPLAFSVSVKAANDPGIRLEREVRYEAATWFKRKKLIPTMIDQVKELLGVADDHRNA